MFERALAAVEPGAAVEEALTGGGAAAGLAKTGGSRPSRVRMLAVGKAADAMARAALRLVPIESGILVTSQPSMLPPDRVRTVVASHPLPDEGSLEAGRESLALVADLDPGDLLLVLLSGGASAMLEAGPVPLADLRTCYEALLQSGLDIRSLNEVRKGLSRVKGGRLAERAVMRGAHVVSLIVSDIVGDPIADIGSGPTAPSSSRGARGRKILEDANLWNTMPTSVKRTLGGSEGIESWRDRSGLVRAFIIANNETACKAAMEEGERRGYRTRILTTSLQGEAREAGPRFVEDALSWIDTASRRATIAGGETTVTVCGTGRGGRNQEFVLSSVEKLERKPAVVLSCGTDGADGNTDAAGAIADGETMSRARALRLDPEEFLEANDSCRFFQALEDLIITGPTGTNVADIQIVLEDRSRPLLAVNRGSRTQPGSRTRQSPRRVRPSRRSLAPPQTVPSGRPPDLSLRGSSRVLRPRTSAQGPA